MTAYHLIIKGKVQGVFFRQSAKRKAFKLGVRGWIKNRADGAVEAIVTGKPDAVAHFIDWCRQGPPTAHVTDIIIEECEAPPQENFVILPS